LNVWGDDYATPDGTGVRDFIHVVDLALGHLKALEALARLDFQKECLTVNLGTGNGYSVLEIVREFEAASGKPIPYKVAPRRSGDIASCYADPNQAFTLLGWRAERGLSEMCTDAWRWQRDNPQGYDV
ncbi:MAG: UDP-glucose 4-epimerase GalE, partial [Nitrospirota bacterium]